MEYTHEGFGFVYDHKSNDYKVVRIVSFRWSRNPSGWASVESVWERSVWSDFLFDFLMKCVREMEKLEVGYGA